MHSYPARKRMNNTRFLSNSYTHRLPQFLPNIQRSLPGNSAYGILHAARALQRRRPQGSPSLGMLNDAESEQTWSLSGFTGVLMMYILCLCPHIFSFFTRTSYSLLDMETNPRCEATNTLLNLA